MERRISTPVVLASASAMLALAVVIYAGLRNDAPPPPAPSGPAPLRMRDHTPEATAESFYDAWRRRRWDEALSVSVGDARRAVQEKKARDDAMDDAERAIAERMWDMLARAPLTLALDEAEILGDERYALRGTAEYSFVNRPYRRRVEFVVGPAGEGHFRVERMTLGEVMTELPAVFRAADDEDRP